MIFNKTDRCDRNSAFDWIRIQ